MFCINVLAQTKQVITYFDKNKTQKHEEYHVISGTETPHGSYKVYDEAGSLMIEANFSNGKLHGSKTTYYDKEVISKEGFPEDYYGKLGGIEEYENGVFTRCKMFQYNNGKQYVWTEITLNSENEHEITAFYTSGTIFMEYKTVNGLEEGPFKKYYEDGKVKEEGNFVKGKINGINKIYNEDGSILFVNDYDPQKQQVFSKEYYPNGQLKNEGIYSIKENTVGNQIGDCKYYKEDGSIDYIEDVWGKRQTAEDIKIETEKAERWTNVNKLDTLFKTFLEKYEAKAKYDYPSDYYISNKKTILFTACGDIYRQYIKITKSNNYSYEKPYEYSKILIAVLEKGISLADVDTKDIEKRLKKAGSIDEKITILTE